MLEENQSASGDWLMRTRLLLGDAAVSRLARSRVCVVGMGAVGSYVVEGLARSGVGWLRLVDFDDIKPSNVNRQLFALRSTLGRPKVEVARERALDINPGCTVEALRRFVSAESMEGILDSGLDILVDAIDSLNPKVDLIEAGLRQGLPVYSALGAATRTDLGEVDFAALFKTSACPLGRLVRKRLRRRGIHDGDIQCVYSKELRNPDAVRERDEDDPEGGWSEHRRGRHRSILGSLSTVTGVFGLRLAHEVILRLGKEPQLPNRLPLLDTENTEKPL
jgi:tRNA A37 threonylcarbamoyladenosine dehydratase